jgi:hypothetical protein
MDPRLEVLLVFLASFVIRIGLPLLITVLLVRWLGELDRRWKEEAGQFIAEEASREIEENNAQAPCWAVRNCAPERRESCPAYARQETPCWQVFRTRDGHLKEICMDCEVFRHAALLAPGD